jgi:hypothetical protein
VLVGHEQITQAETWTFYIPAKIPHAVPGVIELGRVLAEAKTALAPAEFDRLFNERLVPFGRSSANQLIAIASHAVLANPTHAAVLPTAWTILGVLAGIPAELLDPAVREGRVTPTSSRGDAKTLYRALMPSRKAALAVDQPTYLRADTPARRDARLNRMRELAAEGARSDQIAAAVNLHPATCRALMRKHGIDCVADRVTGRSRRLNADRILEDLVRSAHGIAEDIKLIAFEQLTPAAVPEHVASLKTSLKAIGQLVTRLDAKERYAAKTKLAHAEEPRKNRGGAH